MQVREIGAQRCCLNAVAICSDTLGGLNAQKIQADVCLARGLCMSVSWRQQVPEVICRSGPVWTGRFHDTSVSPGLPQTWNTQTASTSRNHSKIVLNENHGRETPPLDETTQRPPSPGLFLHLCLPEFSEIDFCDVSL